jgi:hypothetical protein
MTQDKPEIPRSVPSVSDRLSFDEAIERLEASPLVDGMAAFGSRARSQSGVVSDYDLLVLVDALPAPVFQMITTIGERLADVILVGTSTADAVLLAGQPPEPRSFAGLFARKMQTARLLYDVSWRLQRVQQMVTGAAWEAANASAPSVMDLYADWFWQSLGLLHLERLLRSPEPLSLTTFDMMLSSCLSATWRAYFDVRGLPWEGEKTAQRYWMAEDIGFLTVLRRCFAAVDRNARLDAYRELVTLTLAPVGAVFGKGETAVILADPATGIAAVERTLQYWNALFGDR